MTESVETRPRFELSPQQLEDLAKKAIILGLLGVLIGVTTTGALSMPVPHADLANSLIDYINNSPLTEMIKQAPPEIGQFSTFLIGAAHGALLGVAVSPISLLNSRTR